MTYQSPTHPLPFRSFRIGGWWITDHHWLWNCVDDYGNCIPINPFVMASWVNDSHNLH